METDMRRTNNGAAPTLRQEGRVLSTRYSEWASDDAALEVMDEPPRIKEGGPSVRESMREVIKDARSRHRRAGLPMDW